MLKNEFYISTKNPSTNYYDRYKNSDILEDRETGEVLLATREINRVPESKNDRYHRVQSHEKTRLDVLANKYYRNPLLWWVIAQANDIYDPIAEIPAGTLLRIPDIEVLYGNNGILL